jgi:hypothetical protein
MLVHVAPFSQGEHEGPQNSEDRHGEQSAAALQ